MMRYTSQMLRRAPIAALLGIVVCGGTLAESRPGPAQVPASVPAGPFSHGLSPEEGAALEAKLKAETAKASQLDAKARALLAKRRYIQAEAAALAAVHVPVCPAKTWALLVDIYEQWGKPAAELAAYREWMFPGHTGGNSFSTEMGYALLLAQMGQWPEAAAAYDHYMDLTHANNGQAVQEGMPPAARYTDRAGLLAAASFGVGAFGSGWANDTEYEPAEREGQAAHLREAIRLRPDWAYAHFQLARTLSFVKGHKAEILSEYEAAMSLAQAAGDKELYDLAEGFSRGARSAAWAAAHQAKKEEAHSAEQGKGGGSAAPPK